MTPSPMPTSPTAAVDRDLAAAEEMLSEVAQRPLDEQAALFTEVHRILTTVLGTTADAGGGAAKAR